MPQRWSVTLFCGSVIYITFFYQLGNLAFIGADEPRYARIGEEMNLRGAYVTPTLDYQPWLEKPPLLFWLEAASFKLFGVQEWSARLPTAVLALMTLLVVGAFVDLWGNRRSAILSLLVLCTSGLFFLFARTANTDMPLVAMLTVAMVSGLQATRSNSSGWAAVAGLALALAVLSKGPVAVVLFGGIFTLYFLLRQRLEWSLTQVLVLTGVFLTAAGPWFWMVWKENGFVFLAIFWVNHHLARFLTDLHHHWQPLWFYLPVLGIGFFPWVVFLASAMLRVWQRRSGLLVDSCRGELFLWLWAAVPFAFFSLSQSKLAGYLLPVIPPLAALVGMEWDRWLQGDVVIHRTVRGQLVSLVSLAGVIAAALVWVFYTAYRAPVTGIVLALPILASVCWACWEYRRRRPLPVFLSLVAGMTLFAGLAFWKAAPLLGHYHSARDVSLSVVSRLSPRKPLVLYRYSHHTADYYTDYLTSRESLRDPESLRDYFRRHPQDRYYVLTQQSGWEDLELLSQARLFGHQGNLYLVEVTSGDRRVELPPSSQ